MRSQHQPMLKDRDGAIAKRFSKLWMNLLQFGMVPSGLHRFHRQHL
jgi:hypothetical protein